ncbi:MAG: tRNA lysidine(34) synthetase TilS [Cellvibrionaceae bacterium]
MSLEHAMLVELQAAIQTYPKLKRWVVALSGGLDSSVLLHALMKANQMLVQPLSLAALHINHQLSPRSDEWQAHCQRVAEALDVEFFADAVNIDARGRGLESAAREARYTVFSGFLSSQDCLLMGHHADDQAETVLLRLMRGAGVLGLSGIPSVRPLGDAHLLRPLLQQTREQLTEYAQLHALTWVEDESNESEQFDRNYLRHQVMPLLAERWPQMNKRLVKTAFHLQEAQTLLHDLAEMDLHTLDARVERYGVSIDWKALKQLKPERISNVIRYWCEQQHLSVPDSEQMQQIHEQFFSSSAMLTSAVVNWGNVELRQFNQRLYLMLILDKFSSKKDAMAWDRKTDLDMGSAGHLVLSEDSGQGMAFPDVFDKKSISIRWRTGGERCTPMGRSSSQTVKKLLQEYKLETWLRDRVPLIYIDEQLAAVGDIWLCQEFVGMSDDAMVNVHWVIS